MAGPSGTAWRRKDIWFVLPRVYSPGAVPARRPRSAAGSPAATRCQGTGRPGAGGPWKGGGVPDYSFGWPSRDRETLIRSAIRGWRDGLIILTGSNRLLNFKPSRTGMISLVRPSPEDVLSCLARGGAYRTRSCPPGTHRPSCPAHRSTPGERPAPRAAYPACRRCPAAACAPAASFPAGHQRSAARVDRRQRATRSHKHARRVSSTNARICRDEGCLLSIHSDGRTGRSLASRLLKLGIAAGDVPHV